MKPLLLIPIFMFSSFLFPLESFNSCGIDWFDFLEAQRGCCSHHDGVCGCENGRKVCCDGTYSPTCTCHH